MGYTARGTKSVKVPSIDDIESAFARLNLETGHLWNELAPTPFGRCLLDYFEFRAQTLNSVIQPLLMDKAEAEKCFTSLRKKLKPTCPLPLNKQKGSKKNYSFFTGLVNMLIEANINGGECDYDPRSLTTVTESGKPLRTLSRRVDGAFPSTLNPKAIWEIKEYYYTTTFGSRVADGVYETLLDGMELQELELATGRTIHHTLFIDDRFTWWDCGRSYLCRIVDMLHMGYVDEVIVGKEVLTRLPNLVKEWR